MARRKRFTVRLEMETAASVRVWSSAPPAQQASLRELLQTRVRAPLMHSAPRMDWSGGQPAARATAVYRLSDYDELLQQLSPSADDEHAAPRAVAARGRAS